MMYYHFDVFGVLLHASEEPSDRCTELAAPTAPAGSVAVFDSGVWTVVADNRGVWFDGAAQEVIIGDPRADVSEYLKTKPPGLGYKPENGAWVIDAINKSKMDAADIKLRCVDIDTMAKSILIQFSPLRGVYLARGSRP